MRILTEQREVRVVSYWLMSVVEKEDWKSVIGLVTNAKQVISFVQDVAQKLDYARLAIKRPDTRQALNLDLASRYLHEWATGHGVGSNLWSWNSRTPSIEQGYQRPLSLNQAVFGGVNGEPVLQYLELDYVRKEGLEAAWVP
ncbi:hypothetical protein POTOM_007400 [Populus tomentosa]|uniref:Uncharacterized protein n=1 Tax=Populus tomentosa TaxID=118781 RepID=A0A8X8AFG6_POPTO|nr:hypothetical protein POTOM_007400 [Populus tomentosa]